MASRLEETAKEALEVSRQLLALLSAQPADVAAETLESLVARRDGLLNDLQQVLSQEVPNAATRPLLEALVEQQRALEQMLERQVLMLQKAMQGSQAMRANLASFRRMVDSGTRSRFLDQKR